MERERENPVAVAFHQGFERMRVTAARSFHEIVRLSGPFFCCGRDVISLMRMRRRASRYVHFCL
jgi:hypothetical protein